MNEPAPLSPSFTDTAGRAHTLRFDVEACRRAKTELGVRLTDIWIGDLVFRIRTEPDLAVDLAFLACREIQDPVTFAKLIGVEKLPDVQDAVIAAIVGFSNALVRNEIPEKVARARDETFRNMLSIAEAKAKPVSAEDLGKIADLVTTASSGPRFTDSPASSGWSPPRSPSASSP